MRALLKLLVHASARVKESVPRDNFFRDPEPNHVAHPHKTNNFNQQPMAGVKHQEAIRKPTELNGYVKSNLDKLPEIKLDSVRLDNTWKTGVLEVRRGNGKLGGDKS